MPENEAAAPGPSTPFQLNVHIEGVDENGQPQKVDSVMNYDAVMVNKAFAPADQDQTQIRGGTLEFASSYQGITPEQERAILGMPAAPSSGVEGGPGPEDVVSGRPAPPVEETPPDAGAPSGGVATGISNSLRELPEKIGEQIREQLKDIHGFVVTVSRQPDGSLRIEGDIKRTPGAVPTGAEGEPGGQMERVGGETGTVHEERSQHFVTDAAPPVTVRFAMGAEAGRPTQDQGGTTSSVVSSGASASVRNRGVAVNKVACVEGIALSVNVSLLNLTVTA